MQIQMKYIMDLFGKKYKLNFENSHIYNKIKLKRYY